jgi:hypothetical protein
MGDHIGSGVQPDPALHGAAAFGQQRADLSDRPGDRRAGHPEPAGQHVVGDPVAQVHQGGQQPVDEHQPVPGTGPDRPLPRPIGQPCLLARLPARPELGDQLSQHFPGQSGHPTIGDGGGSGQGPRHTTTLPRP